MYRTFVGSCLLLLAVNVVAISAPWPNSICLPVGEWTCQEQGIRLCNWNRPVCEGGSCYICRGQDTLEPRMCFMNEGGECTPVKEYICGYSFRETKCILDGTNCYCNGNLVTKGPKCEFASCN